MRSGDPALARGLAAERATLRPRSPLAQRLVSRAQALQRGGAGHMGVHGA